MTARDQPLQLTGVVKRFGASGGVVTAVDGVTLAVSAGETVAMLGPNGAGKTTLLDMVCGLAEPSSGRIRTLGRAPRQAVIDGAVASVLQTGGLLRDLTVRETVQVVAALHHRRERVDAVMAEAGLTGLAHRRVGKCSGGEKQRIKYALALIPDPLLLVLDEPTAGLDQEGRAELWDHVRRRAASGTTVLYSTHHLEEIEGLADRVIVLDRGRVVGDSPVADLTGETAIRQLCARVADAATARQAARLVGRMAGVRLAEADGERVRIMARPGCSDEVALRLLSEFAATDLTVRPPSLSAALQALARSGE
jgi:ABC-2 type transport system ATP-binding protein